MVVHIVMFTFKEQDKALNIAKVKDKLEELESKIEELKSMEVGINFTDSPRAMDLSLYATFQTQDDLKTYASHPEHLKVVEFIRDVTVESKVVDYILE